MDSEDHLGNVFSDEEDSFDAPVPMSRSSETEECADEESQETEDVVEEVRELDLEEEDFDLITIEKVSMNVLVTRMIRIISEIMQRGEPAAKALFDVATKIVFQSTMLDSEQNTVIDVMMHGLSQMIVDVRERDERAERGEQILMLLVVKLAIKNKSLKCDDLLLKLILFIDYFYLHIDSIVRVRICRLMYLIVEESNRYTEAVQEEGDNAFLFTDGEPPEVEVIIPNGVKNRWMNKLAKSLRDKVPLVRCAAVSALSLWDYDTVHKNRNGDETIVNDLLWKSLYDVDEGVRIVAARRVHVIGEADIDRCMNYVETSKDTKVRQAIVIRLASDVHLFSLSEDQRFRLVNILNNSSSARVQDTIHQRLVDAWMIVAASELVCPTIFPAPGADDHVPNGFPSIILEYLDALVDPKACYVFLKFATVRYIRNGKSQQADSVDLEKFMMNLLAMTPSESECVGLMRRSTFRLVDDEEKDSLKKTYIRVFITRCFMDVVFQLSRGRLDAVSLRNRALMFFVPDVTIFSKHLEKFCERYFQHSDEPVSECTEVLLGSIFHLINVSVKHADSSFDKEAYKSSLENLLENPDLEFSSEIVVTMVTTIIDLCQNGTEVESTCEWICDTARELLLTREDADSWNEQTLEGAMKEGVVQERMYFRSAKMLLAICQHEEVREPSHPMSSLFKTMIPALLGNQNEKIQVIGLELIGFAAVIDFENCGPYLKLTRLLILREDLYLKATGLNTLVRVVKAHGFPKTAASIFETAGEEEADQAEESLAKLIEKTVVSLHGVALAQAVRDCLSMLSYGDYAWPRLLSALLLIVFQKSNVELQLVKLFEMYCKASIRSKWSKALLLQAFTRAIGVITKSSESDASWNLGDMTSVVCEHLSSVQTIGEDEDDLQMGDKEDPINIEIEMATRMINRAVSFPSAWFVRHIFTSMATFLSLQCVPIKQLRDLHNMLLDAYVSIRFNSGKTTQIAVKRFIAHCEKMIGLYDRRHGLNLKMDLKKVKREEEDPDYAIASASSSSSGTKRGRKRKSTVSPQSNSKKWDNDGLDGAVESDDSFEYFPQSTRTRNLPIYSIEESPPPQKRPNSRLQMDINLDDSFEL